MRICFVGNAKSIHMLKWARWFSNRHEVHLLTDQEVEIPGVQIHYLGGGHGAFALFRKAMRCRKIVRQLDPDIVHSHYASSYGMMGAMSGRHPFIISSWGSDITADSYSFLKRLPLKFALRRADYTSAYDRVLVERLAEIGFDNILRKRIVGTDMEMFSPIRAVENLPSLVTIPDPLLICTRVLTARGGVETIIRAMPKVVHKFPDTKLMLIYLVNNDEQALKDLAYTLGVQGNVIFVGQVEHVLMPSYLATSSVFIDTFSSENRIGDELDRYPGLGATAMEAMACGTPVVIPVSEMTADPERPFATYIHRNPDSLAEAIIGLLDERTHAQMSERGLDYIREVASNEKIMGEWEEFYSSLLAN